ncbi:orf 40 [Ateline gammaherpesvirus 3]|uniref:Orf 40 n=1 Tax=Ateline herpesvirus 3 TaxID=85618 RepID=Q9YTM5_ATHV3|nr:orf 40 [Ateline gammaherpesvirus 3]AAC95566.1 orf 40 [Ateline gammaherpesvirus 3]
METINTVDCHIIGIYFYNVILEKNLIIWQLNLITCPDHESMPCFVVDLLSCEDRDSVVSLSSGQPTSQSHGVPLMLWELKLRMSQPILQTCMTYMNQPVSVLMCTNRVVLEVRPVCKKKACPGGYLKGGYLYSQCTQTLAPVPKAITARPIDRWYPYLLRNSTIQDIDIHIKCSEGLYRCSATREPPLKKTQQINIEDLFKIENCSFVVAKIHINVRTIIPIFHLLWVNVECKWNGCLPEFFRALHSRVYKDFDGIVPVFTYLLPGGCQEATPFDIYFCGFPFVNLNCNRPAKIHLCNIPRLHCPQILLSVPGNYVDDLLCKPRDIPLPSMPRIWPINAVDINSKFSPDDKSEVAVLNYNHIIVEVDILYPLCHVIGCATDEINNIILFGSKELNNRLQTWYNWFISTIFKWTADIDLTWTAITSFKLYFSSMHSSEKIKVR